jgi:hypothetical protein
MMKRSRWIRFACLAAVLAAGTAAVSQKVVRKAPTPQDWAALAKLPDLAGVWEVGLGGGVRDAERVLKKEHPRRQRD